MHVLLLQAAEDRKAAAALRQQKFVKQSQEEKEKRLEERRIAVRARIEQVSAFHIATYEYLLFKLLLCLIC